MPAQINGIGTTYLGQSNTVSEFGFCEQCGGQSTLVSYETGHWFTLFFIPVIPLGRKMILNSCGNCTRHHVMSLGEWQTVRDQSIQSSVDGLAANMNDSSKAFEHLGTLTAFFQFDEARDLAAAMENSFADDADAMLGLGSWYEQQQMIDLSDRCFDRAFELDPKNRGSIRAHGLGLVEKDQLQKAADMLSIFLPPAEDFDPAIYYVLATAFQNKGNHLSALENFSIVVFHSPEWKQDKDFCKSVRLSERALGHEQSIVPRDNSFTWAAVLAALVLIAGIVIAAIAWSG